MQGTTRSRVGKHCFNMQHTRVKKKKKKKERTFYIFIKPKRLHIFLNLQTTLTQSTQRVKLTTMDELKRTSWREKQGSSLGRNGTRWTD